MSLEDDILIDKFIEKTLSNEDLDAFLKRMDADKDFEKKVRLEQQLRETLNDDDWSFNSKQTEDGQSYEEMYKSDAIKKLQKTIQDVNTSYQKPKINNRIKWISFASAAAIAFIIALKVFNTNVSSYELYESYSNHSNLPSYISREDGNENDLIKAQLLFENKEYEKSMQLFRKELKNSSKPDAGIYLYLGIAQTELDDFGSAEKTFNTLSNSDLLDAQKGAWFKALLYLKMDQPKKSKEILKEIIEQNLYNAEKAEELLKKLP